MVMPIVNTDKLLSPSKAAPIMGVSTRRVHKYCEEGRLGLRIGRHYYIPMEQAKTFQPKANGRPPKNEKRPAKSRKKRGQK
jgi:hypothetical protein